MLVKCLTPSDMQTNKSSHPSVALQDGEKRSNHSKLGLKQKREKEEVGELQS